MFLFTESNTLKLGILDAFGIPEEQSSSLQLEDGWSLVILRQLSLFNYQIEVCP